MTEKEQRMFDLGKKTGRDELLAEIYAALKIDEKIAEALNRHEEQMHEAN